MINDKQILKAINEKLRQKFENIKIYGINVKEGFTRPSFYVTLELKENAYESTNYIRKKHSIYIKYFQKTNDDVDNMNKEIGIEEIFRGYFKVENVVIRVTDFEYNYIGTDNNILQCTLETEYYDTIDKVEKHVLAEEIEIN